MAAEREHLKQAWHNTILSKELSDQKQVHYRDWIITVSFYAALHFVEAWLSTTEMVSAVRYKNSNNVKKSIHKIRSDLVKNNTDRSTAHSYKQLYTMSMQARYLMNNGAIAAYNYFDNSDAERAVSDYLVNIISYFNYNDSQDEFEISDILN